MREIKFRAWDKDLKRMLIPSELQSKHSWMTWNGLCYENGYLLNYEMMQYTGLKDRKGKEIYEGDIIRNGLGKVYQVIYVNFAWQLKFDIHNNGFSLIKVEEYEHVHWTGPSNFDAPQYTELAIEIIGNIYENPELLTPKGE